MKIEQRLLSPDGDWQATAIPLGAPRSRLAFVFGPRKSLECETVFSRLRAAYPDTRLVIASDAGEIAGVEVCDDRLAVTAVAFEESTIETAAMRIADREESFQAGRNLAQQLAGPRHRSQHHRRAAADHAIRA